MRFLHTADLHLGAVPDADRHWGKERADAVRTSLMRLIDLCIREDVDLLLIAGDLFDAPPLTQELKDVNFLFSTLPHTKVVLIAGNHDFVRPGSAYSEFCFAPNVFFLSGSAPQTVSFPQWNLEVHGFSYDCQELTDRRLETLSAPRDGKRHILLAHGGDSLHLPFRTARLAEQGWDYIALGHLHRPATALEGRLAFPGSPEPLDRTETGEHGCFIGELKADRFSVEWRRLSDFRYTELTVNLSPETTPAALEALIRKRVQDASREVFSLTLAGRRDRSFRPDTEALCRIPNVAAVKDTSEPDYPWAEWEKRPEHDLLGRYIRALAPAEDTPPAEAALRRRALDLGLEALLDTASAGKGVVK